METHATLPTLGDLPYLTNGEGKAWGASEGRLRSVCGPPTPRGVWVQVIHVLSERAAATSARASGLEWFEILLTEHT